MVLVHVPLDTWRVLDDWRVKENGHISDTGLVHDKDDPCRLDGVRLVRLVREPVGREVR